MTNKPNASKPAIASPFHYVIFDETGEHRLSALGVSGFWDRLVWEIKGEPNWTLVSEITRQEFQVGDGTKQFVQALHSFNPKTGIAIIKVGHGDAVERNPAGVNYNYSWREWDLRAKREVRFLRACENIDEDSYAAS
ncbi:MAG: hypothetical protein JWM68_294 [Verrucomicrobiales bacterium]|nr:hypothetical protein [Verrucomicrobiales bacterium]